MSIKNAVLPVPLTSILSTAVGDDYSAINPDGLPESCHIIRIINDGSLAVSVSYNGVTDHEYVPAGDSLLIYAMFVKERAAFRKGTVLYVKGTTGQSGRIYLSGYYQAYN